MNTSPPRIFIIGSPRSGTTWVAKLFDAHPWVLYRHEPDSVVPTHEFPGLVPSEEQDLHLDKAGKYVDGLYDVSTVKTNGAQPAFPKAFRSEIKRACNRGVFFAFRACENIGAIRDRVRRWHIPDCVSASDWPSVRPVIKSVVAGGRAALFARACPQDRFVLVVRHPAGFVASGLRGRRLGRMQHQIPFGALSEIQGARERGLDLEAFQNMETLEQLAWFWVLFNEKMIAETADLENCLLVSYDAMCEDPAAEVDKMYRHAGLELLDDTRRFLEKTQTADPSEADYFSLFRDPKSSANKWRRELTDDEISRVRDIASESVPGRLFSF